MPFSDLVDSTEFQRGLSAGAVALLVAVLVVVALARRGAHRSRTPLPVAGIAFVAAALVALDGAGAGERGLLSGRLLAGLALLALGAIVAARRPSWATTALGAIPGALVVAWAVDVEGVADWILPLVAAAIVVGGTLVTDFDRANARAGLGPVLIAVSALAMYTAVPDTEEIAAVVGAALPLVLLGTPRALASLGRIGASSAVGLLVWVAAVGGRGRPGSIVGAIACLGLLLVEPLVRRALRPRWRSSLDHPLAVRTMLVIALDLGLVAVTSRVAGFETSGAAAAVIAAIALTAAAIVLALVLVPWSRRSPGSPSPQAHGTS